MPHTVCSVQYLQISQHSHSLRGVVAILREQAITSIESNLTLYFAVDDDGRCKFSIRMREAKQSCTS